MNHLCDGALVAHREYISENRSLKKATGRVLLASATVDRAIVRSPK